MLEREDVPNTDTESNTTKREIKKTFNRLGWFWYSPNAGQYGKSGIADILSIHNSVSIAVEAKYGNNKPTGHQVAFLKRFDAEGGIAFCINEKMTDMFNQFMDDFEYAARAAGRQEPIDKGVAERMRTSQTIMQAMWKEAK